MGQLINRQPISDDELAAIRATAGPDFEDSENINVEDSPEAAYLIRKLNADGVTADGIAYRRGIGFCAFAWVD